MSTASHPSSPSICPVCGGYLSSRPAHGKPCSCPPRIEPFNPSSDTVDDDPNSGTKAPLAADGKRCCQCGKDLTGHRRFKDSVGYWCKDCHRTDKARHKAAESRCPDCGRMIRITALTVYHDRNLCPTCLKEARLEDQKKQNKAIIAEAHTAHERRNLYILLAIFAVLLILIALSRLHHH
jgi:hypothetical protein